MSVRDYGGVVLGMEEAGGGPIVVLVHGAWSDRSTWDPVFAAFAQRFRTIRYDRRGYGESQRPGTDPNGHVEDLLTLIDSLGREPVTLIGNSIGAIIAILVALRMVDRIHCVIAHEPPILRLLELELAENSAARRAYRALHQALDAARGGDHALAAKLYVEGMAAFPGTWDGLPEEVQRGFVRHAPAFLTDSSALGQSDVAPEDCVRLGSRLIVTRGARTSSYMKLIIDRLYREVPQLRRHEYALGGHVPQQSCPREFVAKTIELIDAT